MLWACNITLGACKFTCGVCKFPKITYWLIRVNQHSAEKQEKQEKYKKLIPMLKSSLGLHQIKTKKGKLAICIKT